MQVLVNKNQGLLLRLVDIFDTGHFIDHSFEYYVIYNQDNFTLLAGALIIVINYTGDRINFGLALERAKAEGLSCDMVVVGEDCALTSHDRTAGRRGLCGVTFVNKVSVLSGCGLIPS